MGRYHVTSHGVTKGVTMVTECYVIVMSQVIVTWRLWEIEEHSHIVIVYIV